MTYSGCGAAPSPSSLTVGDTVLSFTNIGVAALGTCTITVSVTGSADGTYNNSSGHLFVGTADTGSAATDTLLITSKPAPPSTCGSPTTLATWSFDSLPTGRDLGPINADSMVGDVSGAQGIYGAGSQTTNDSGIVTTTTDFFPKDPTGFLHPKTPPSSPNVWGIEAGNSGGSGGWLGTGSVPNGVAPYFQFQINAANYGGIGIAASANLDGSWSNGDKWFIYSSTDGATWELGKFCQLGSGLQERLCGHTRWDRLHITCQYPDNLFPDSVSRAPRTTRQIQLYSLTV